MRNYMFLNFTRLCFILLIYIVFSACSTKDQIPLEPSVEIKPAEIKRIVSYLSSDDLQGRRTGSDGIEKAAQFIENELSSYDIIPFYESYRDNFLVEGEKAYNILGLIEGSDSSLKDEYIIISAHYDHIGLDKTNSDDQIVNGANDNASGTAGVLALANYFSKEKINKRSIIFVLFSAEEFRLLGSKHLADRLEKSGLNLYAMLNLEMIGVPLKNNEYFAYITGFHKSNLAAKFNEYSKQSLVGFLPQAQGLNLFRRSDNYPFFKTFNIPAHTISSFDFQNYDFYHKPGDEAHELDYVYMANLLNNLKPALVKLTRTTQQEIKIK